MIGLLWEPLLAKDRQIDDLSIAPSNAAIDPSEAPRLVRTRSLAVWCAATLKLDEQLPQPTSDADLKILVIDENPIRRAILETGLTEAGFLM